MDRVEALASSLTKGKTSTSDDPALEEERKRQRLQSKFYQVLEDHIRVFAEFKSKSKVEGEEFSKLIFGPTHSFLEECNNFVKNDPDFSLARLSDGTKDEQRYLTNKLLFKFFKRFPLNMYRFVNEPWYFSSLFAVLTGFYPPVGTKVAVHMCLYTKSILMLGSDKHHKYIERAIKLKDLGCFGLTELAHGSNVQGIITTATFDEQYQDFVLNTPHEKGMKFWIGGAAQSANMAVIAANLIVNGKGYGVHLFIVPIRDEVSHDICPGITIGDCGVKQGINGVDNGFITFRNVRVPLDNLLDKITQVSPSGVVTSVIQKKELRFAVQLSALSEGRVKISLTVLLAGLKASAIVLRFAAARRQFGNQRHLELPIIDYPGYQNRVIPRATNFIIGAFATMESNQLWQDNYKNVFDQQNKQVKEMHAIISCLKPVYTWWLLDSLSEFRTAMGGLGYSKHSELGAMIDDYHVMVTWEGDNYVLIQQTAKFLMDRYMKALQGKPSEHKYPSTDYITTESLEAVVLQLQDPAQLQDVEFLHQIMKYRAARVLQNVSAYIMARMAEGADQFAVFTEALAIGLTEASVYYGELYIFRSAVRGIANSKSQPNREFLSRLLQIFAIDKILSSAGHLPGYLNTTSITLLQKTKVKLYSEVKYDIVKCMDDLFMENHFVISPFGNKDGNIYGRFISKLLGEQGNFGKPVFWKEIWEMKNAN